MFWPVQGIRKKRAAAWRSRSCRWLSRRTAKPRDVREKLAVEMRVVLVLLLLLLWLLWPVAISRGGAANKRNMLIKFRKQPKFDFISF